jgi:hypothetical protein
MKKIVVIFSVVAVILAALFVNTYMEVKAIKNVKIEIYDVEVEKIWPNIVINISMRLYNNESKEIKSLQGDFDIYILNVSTGRIRFEKINIEAKSYSDLDTPLILYYGQIAKSIIEAIKSFDFSLSIKGKIEGKIFFGLIKYEKPVEAIWRIE